MLYHHKIDPRIFDEMLPFEKDIYVGMLVAKVEEENEKLKLEQSAKRARVKRGR
jgi:hypothetical protein